MGSRLAQSTTRVSERVDQTAEQAIKRRWRRVVRAQGCVVDGARMTDERKPQRRRLTKQEIAERYDALLAGVDAVAHDIRATSMMHSADAAFREQWTNRLLDLVRENRARSPNGVNSVHHDGMDSSRFRCSMMQHQLMPISTTKRRPRWMLRQWP